MLWLLVGNYEIEQRVPRQRSRVDRETGQRTPGVSSGSSKSGKRKMGGQIWVSSRLVHVLAWAGYPYSNLSENRIRGREPH